MEPAGVSASSAPARRQLGASSATARRWRQPGQGIAGLVETCQPADWPTAGQTWQWHMTVAVPLPGPQTEEAERKDAPTSFWAKQPAPR